MSLSDTKGEVVAIADNAAARLAVSRHACALFWAHGVTGTSGDDIASAAGLSTRTIWRYFRSKESCVEPVLAKSLDRFLAVVARWPAELSLGEHLAADAVTHPLTPQDIDDEISAMRIATMTASEPVLRAAEEFVKQIVRHYGDPNLTFEEIRAAALAAKSDPLGEFSLACRRELRDILRRGTVSATDHDST